MRHPFEGYYGAAIGQQFGQPVGGSDQAAISRAAAPRQVSPGVFINPSYYITGKGAGLVDEVTGLPTPRGRIEAAIGAAVDQRAVRKATREVQAIVQLHRNGTHNLMQTGPALEQLEAEYDAGVLSQVPGYNLIRGVEKVYDGLKERHMTEYAKVRGWDRTHVMWDDKKNAPAPDPKAMAADSAEALLAARRAEVAAIPAKAQNDAKKAALLALADQAKVTANRVKIREDANQDASQLSRFLDHTYVQMGKVIRGEMPDAAPAPATVVAPMSSSIPTTSFDGKQELDAALDNGFRGEFILSGVRGYVGPDGRPRKR